MPDEPPPLPEIARRRSLKMLGVIIGDDFSVGQHVPRLVTSSAQTHYALLVLRCHGLNTAALHAARLPSDRRRSSHVRRQRMAWFHQGV